MPLLAKLRADRVADIGPRKPVTVGLATSLGEVIGLMQKHATGCITVCRDGQVVGVFTERDLLRRSLGLGAILDQPIESVMTSEPATAEMDESVAQVIMQLDEGGYRRLPVVNAAGEPVGVVSVRQVVHYLADRFATSIYNLPSDGQEIQSEREGA